MVKPRTRQNRESGRIFLLDFSVHKRGCIVSVTSVPNVQETANCVYNASFSHVKMFSIAHISP